MCQGQKEAIYVHDLFNPYSDTTLKFNLEDEKKTGEPKLPAQSHMKITNRRGNLT